MTWRAVAYSLACVIVPVAWGLLVVWASNRLDRYLLPPDRDASHKRRTPPPIEYHI